VGSEVRFAQANYVMIIASRKLGEVIVRSDLPSTSASSPGVFAGVNLE
jgi:hypothetical protein